MKQSNFLFKPAVYIALAVYFALAFFTLSLGSNVVATLVPEDHFFELIGAFSLFVTSVLFFYAFWLARKALDKSWFSLMKRLVFLGLGLLFFFGAGEEISWGQRILGFKTPEALSQVNRQQEFNLHNLSTWEASDFLDPDRLFDIFWFVFGVFIPGLALAVPTFKRFAGKLMPLVFWGMSVLFLYNYLWAKLSKILFRASYTFEKISFPQAIQEIKESNYAIIFILVGLYAIWELSRPQSAT